MEKHFLMLRISNSLLWHAISIRRSEINLVEFETITRQSLNNKTETKLSTIFACPLNELMIVREMTFNFEAFVRPTKADASSFSAQPTICRIARLIGHLAVKFASPVFVVSRTYASSGWIFFYYGLIIILRSYASCL